jgi:1-acyl-sn-glycerol-3-phosphate acyltransferase
MTADGSKHGRDGTDDPARVRSETLFWLFGWYLRWYFWRRFHAVRLSRSGLPRVPAGRPVIVFSNHPSWWDPALYILLQTTLFAGRRGFGPMDAAALGQYGVLQRMGVFGIELDSPRGAARFLKTSLRLLADPRTVFWITAEGAFTDPRTRPVRLRPGVAHLARRVPGAVILPLAIEYTFWNESRPEALARFGPPIETGRERGVAEWQALLEGALAETMDALAAESAARNPGLFVPLVRGGAGVGGIYDLQRRVRALLRGRRFDPTHGGREAGE